MLVGIAMAATVLIAAASFFVSQRLIAENRLQTHRSALQSFQRQVEFESRELIRMLEAMARNAFISNALIDSLGRDQYLLPFLRDQSFPGGWRGALWLVDFKGRPIASNTASRGEFAYLQSPALQTALASGKPQAEDDAGKGQLMVAFPVVFPPTGSVEGAVVAIVDLHSIMDHNAALVATTNCFRAHIGKQAVLMPADCKVAYGAPVFGGPLALPGALAALDARLELFAEEGAGRSTTAFYLLVYLGVIGAVFLAVLWASRRIAARVVEPLAQVTQTANTIVRDGQLDLRVAATGSDEVGQLAASFNHMVEGLQAAQARMREDMDRIRRAEGRLQSLNAELERRVAERTADLEVTIADLSRAREAAERANHAKSEFLSRMSHELRTPLNAILGFAQVLRMRGAKQTDLERLQYVGQIEKAGWHLLELIKELLDLSRIEAGSIVISREPVHLQRLCAECIELLRPLARAGEVTLHDRSVEVEPLYALGDRTRLSQVLMNLLSNAVKYNRRGGSVTLALRTVDVDWVEIVVADTGRGFTPDQLRELYQPFNRLGADRVGVDGTGIGLVISKRLMEMMGGRIDLTSEAGAGSVFTMRLQRSVMADAPRAAAASSSAAAADVAPTATKTVLYIEDNPSNIELVESALALRPNVTVLSAPDGQTGLQIAERARPDLILIDIALPGIDGNEVCRRLRARGDSRMTPILAVSANAMPTDIERGKAAGFDGYLTKPLDIAAFLAQVDRLLSGRAQ